MGRGIVIGTFCGASICILLTAGAARAQPSAQSSPNVSLHASDDPDQPDASGQSGGDQAADLAKKLQNPVANLISVPFQNNFDYGGGAKGHGSQYTINIQPVIPFKLTPDWNLIIRTIVPVTEAVHVQSTEVSGLADIVQSFFFSPAQPIGGLIVGVGPVFLYPTATNDRISANQWAAGPTAVVLKQAGPWTVGMLANHLQGFGRIGHNGLGGSSVLGEDGFTTTTSPGHSARVSATYVQPFASYTFPTFTTLNLSTESTYDWTAQRWTVPVIAGVSQLLKLGSQPISVGLSGKYTAMRPVGAPAWGIRLSVTLLFPK
jgi:hypothetical protein